MEGLIKQRERRISAGEAHLEVAWFNFLNIKKK